VSAPFHKSGKGRAHGTTIVGAQKPANKLKIYLPSFAAESLQRRCGKTASEELSTMGTKVTRSRLEDLQRLQGVGNQKTISLAFGGADLPPHNQGSILI